MTVGKLKIKLTWVNANLTKSPSHLCWKCDLCLFKWSMRYYPWLNILEQIVHLYGDLFSGCFRLCLVRSLSVLITWSHTVQGNPSWLSTSLWTRMWLAKASWWLNWLEKFNFPGEVNEISIIFEKFLTWYKFNSTGRYFIAHYLENYWKTLQIIHQIIQCVFVAQFTSIMKNVIE